MRQHTSRSTMATRREGQSQSGVLSRAETCGVWSPKQVIMSDARVAISPFSLHKSLV